MLAAAEQAEAAEERVRDAGRRLELRLRLVCLQLRLQKHASAEEMAALENVLQVAHLDHVQRDPLATTYNARDDRLELPRDDPDASTAVPVHYSCNVLYNNCLK